MVNVPRTAPLFGGWTSSEILGQRRTLAFHEAGHAVAAWSLGAKIRLVTIRPIAGGLGACHFTADAFLLTNRDRLAITLAGMAAEARVLVAEGFQLAEGARPDGFYGGSDMRTAERTLQQVLREERTRQRRQGGGMRLSEHAEELVRAECWRSAHELLGDPRRWRMVERVAASLLDREELGPAAFERLMVG